MLPQKVYPRRGDPETVYLKSVVTDTSIIVGDYTMYNDFVNDHGNLKRTMFCTIIQSITIS